ncbi:hypothetical protein [Streptomyces sp. CB02261]|uniref:hypothetical protein n=1 Tax=Streptomyces sp. CB02261 TaxID=1703940 RepID=UPI000A7851B6|nr:hypothetical protein [Streptomyces sp. CB02261]
MTAAWYVLIEEDTRTTQRVDGTDLKLHRWMLAGTHRIGQDHAEAVAAAEDAALHFLPGILARHARPGERACPSCPAHSGRVMGGAGETASPRMPCTGDHGSARAFAGREGSTVEEPEGKVPQCHGGPGACGEALDLDTKGKAGQT